MSGLAQVATVAAGPRTVGIAALEVAWISGTAHLLTGSGANGGLVSYVVDPSGLTHVDHDSAGPNSGTGGLADLDVIDAAGAPSWCPRGGPTTTPPCVRSQPEAGSTVSSPRISTPVR